MTWANVMGSNTDKTRFAEMLDRWPRAVKVEGNNGPEHPDFLPPSLAGTLYEHNNFAGLRPSRSHGRRPQVLRPTGRQMSRAFRAAMSLVDQALAAQV